MSVVSDQLERVVAGHDSIGSPLRSYLQPGEAHAVLREQLRTTDSAELQPLIDLWSTYNGIDYDHPAERQFRWLFDHAHWPQAADAADKHRWLFDNRARIDPVTEPDEVWRPTWFPVFELDKGYIAVDTGTSEGEVWVVYFEPIEFDPTRILASSLDGFLAGVAEQFERGEYVWDDSLGQVVAADGLSVDLYQEPTQGSQPAGH